MGNFKYIVGQEVKILSKDRNLNGKTVKISARFGEALSTESERWYKVTGDGIASSLSFFEDQLEVIS